MNEIILFVALSMGIPPFPPPQFICLSPKEAPILAGKEAIYQTATRKVLVNEKNCVDGKVAPYREDILVHELTHVAQHIKGEVGKRDIPSLEEEARRVTDEWRFR